MPLDNADFRQFMTASTTALKNYTEDMSKKSKEKSKGKKKLSKDPRDLKELDKDDLAKIVKSEYSSRKNKKHMESLIEEEPTPSSKQVPSKVHGVEPKYRDRAKERREGDIEEEEQQTEALVTKLLSTQTGVSVLGGTDLEADDIEKSKLLGGDVEHTHLVKGLDFALMQRTREELEAKKKEQLKQKEKSQKAAGTILDAKEPTAVKFKSKVAKGIVQVLKMEQERQYRHIETFKPARSYFVFDLEDKGSSTLYDVPSMVVRSKAEVDALDDTTSTRLPKLLLDRLENIIQYVRGTTEKSKRRKRKVRRDHVVQQARAQHSASSSESEEEEEIERQPDGPGHSTLPQETKATPATDHTFDMEDIFPDAGKEYVPSEAKPQGSQNPLAQKGAIFEKRDEDVDMEIEDLQHPEEEPEQAKKEGPSTTETTQSSVSGTQIYEKYTYPSGIAPSTSSARPPVSEPPRFPGAVQAQSTTSTYQPISLENHDGIERGWARVFTRDENALRRRTKLSAKDIEEAMSGGSLFGDMGGGYEAYEYDSDEEDKKKRRRRKKQKKEEGAESTAE